jgi:hypothetical protein
MTEPLPIAECRLDACGLQDQRERYARLGRQAAEVRRGSDELRVQFRADLDEELLEEAIAVENKCCPFFSFGYSPRRRLLTIGVADPKQEPALDAVAFALTEGR